MSQRLYSFRRLFGEAKIASLLASVDGQRLPDFSTDADRRSLNIYAAGRQNWREADISVVVETPFQELKTWFGDLSNVKIVTRINCSATNLRAATVSDITEASTRATLTIARELFEDRAKVDAFVVAQVDGIDDRILREADPWTIFFSEPVAREVPDRKKRRSARDIVDTVWSDFSNPTGDLGFLKPYERETCYLDFTGNSPTMYLNEAIDGYKVLLELSRPDTRFESALHDMEIRRLAFAAWIGMFTSAVAGVDVDEQTSEVLLPDGWEGDVLKALLPKIFPSDTLQSAARKVHALLKDPATGMAYLQSQAQVSVSEMLGTSNILKRHLVDFVKGRGNHE